MPAVAVARLVCRVMRLLEQAQKEHGKLKWNQLFGEAIGLADNGFRIPGRLADAIASNASSLALDANAMATYFYPDGSPRKVGETMTNKAYAKTLEALASQGANALHTGPIAQAIVAKAGQALGMTHKNSNYPKFDDLAGFIELSSKKTRPDLYDVS